MNDLLNLLLALGFCVLTLSAYALTLQALFPQRLARARAVAKAMPGRAFGLGLINLGFFLGIALAFSALADATGAAFIRLPAVVLVLVVSWALSFGLAAVLDLVGERLFPTRTPFWRTVFASSLATLGSALPLAGWFILLPYLCALGTGAFIISFFWQEKDLGAEGNMGKEGK